MAGKFKTTGFARFFMFILIAAPLIYSGVALFNGQNPLESAKRDLGIETTAANGNDYSSETDTKTSELADLRSEISALKDENHDLRKKLENCQ